MLQKHTANQMKTMKCTDRFFSAYICTSNTCVIRAYRADYCVVFFFQHHVMKLLSVHCAVPLLEPSLGRGGDVGAVAVREENSLCLVFVLNWQMEKHIRVEIKTSQFGFFFCPTFNMLRISTSWVLKLFLI